MLPLCLEGDWLNIRELRVLLVSLFIILVLPVKRFMLFFSVVLKLLGGVLCVVFLM